MRDRTAEAEQGACGALIEAVAAGGMAADAGRQLVICGAPAVLRYLGSRGEYVRLCAACALAHGTYTQAWDGARWRRAEALPGIAPAGAGRA